MPDMYFDVDTALTEVPVNIMPLLDDTDFKTIEAAVAYNAAGMALFWHFVTSAGVYNNGVAVTPTTAGDYDWTDHGTHGIYTIEIPASGGASINNDTEGYGWFTGVATGVLPWRGPVIGFRAAALNDALCDGGDNLDVNTVQWLGTACATPTVAGVPEVDVTHIGGDAQSGTDLKDFADAGYDPATNKVQGVVLVDTATTLTNLPAITANWLTTAGTAADFKAAMATAIWTDTVAGNYTAELSIGKSVMNGVALGTGLTINAYTGNTVQTGDSFARIGAAGAGLTAVVAASVTGAVGSVTGAVGSVTGAVGSVTGNVGGNVAGSVGSVTGAVGSVTGAVGSVTGLTASDVGAIKAKTDSLTYTVAGVVDANIQRINDVTITGNGQVGTEFNV